MNKIQPKVDDYSRYGRAVVGVTLCILLAVLLLSVILAIHGASTIFPNTRAVQVLIPVAIVLIVAVAQRRRRGLGVDTDGVAWNAMFEDEFRQQSLARAVRVALIIVLVLQLPVGMLMDALLPQMSKFFMGYITLLLGVIAFLAAFLFCDRGAA